MTLDDFWPMMPCEFEASIEADDAASTSRSRCASLCFRCACPCAYGVGLLLIRLWYLGPKSMVTFVVPIPNIVQTHHVNECVNEFEKNQCL